MAIAGLHSVPVFETSILRDSQSSLSGRRGNIENVSTRASSILQRWRELEDECAVNAARGRGSPRLPQETSYGYRESEARVTREGSVESDNRSTNNSARVTREGSVESDNRSTNNSESQLRPLNDQVDRQSLSSEQSQDLGEVGGERVRKILLEFRSSSENAETPRFSNSNGSSRGLWLGENERERVRVVRDWIQMNSQQRDNQVVEGGSQIEQVGYGENDQREGQPENNRRQFRKLCGRQALLDLLTKKQEERQQELQELEGTGVVSGFAPRLRNRIQSLLRLKNMRSAESRGPSSARESELGLLRERQTVSGLREGFLSRLDNSANVQASELSDGPSDIDSDACREDQTQVDGTNEVLDGASVLNNATDEVLNSAYEQTESVEEVDALPSTMPPSMDFVRSSADQGQQTSCSAGNANALQIDGQIETTLEHDSDNYSYNRPEAASSDHSGGSPEVGSPRMSFQELSRSPSEDFSLRDDVPGSFQEENTVREETITQDELDDQIHASENEDEHESNMLEDDWQEQVSEYESSVFSSQWRNDEAETSRHQWPGDVEDLSHRALESEGREQNVVQEDLWPENSSEPRNWPGTPGSILASERVDTYYFSDDDNVHHVELRELMNRGRVSELLHSNFRENLDQLIQSYVERQANAPDDWELHEMLPPPYLARNRERQRTDQESGPNDIHADESRPALPTPPPPPPPQTRWGQGLPSANWTGHEIRQRPGTEWEIINDLRIDMAKIQQRLTNMQRMLEACMDMQLELQRTVRQEVSAALNRSRGPSEPRESTWLRESFEWDSVRKGICCMCSTTNIDSLLYRCGHMCTCTKCADVLVQANGKCPMCQAPVIEVIRAYFIQ